MFTGIIEEIGTIANISRDKIHTVTVTSNLSNATGDSIAIQGICLTVTEISPHGFSVQAMRPTKRVTTLSDWRKGTRVNCERALRMGSRLGGHIMLGHVDEVARCIRRVDTTFYFQVSTNGARYCVPKGSIGIDGVSLTISSVSQNIISVNIIPFTAKHTTLSTLRAQSFVNIEFDYLAKCAVPG